ncbi:MAG: hypothetical protein ABR958_06015 [Dehalococcoidales bacterium]|jgi:hypothetical protein
MVSQMLDTEAIDLEIKKSLQKYQQEYKISNAELAWVLLRLGTSYYFKDISSRGLNGNQPLNTNGM